MTATDNKPMAEITAKELLEILGDMAKMRSCLDDLQRQRNTLRVALAEIALADDQSAAQMAIHALQNSINKKRRCSRE